MVVACVALAVALGGTGYAAITLPRNSVGSSQLKSNSVTGAKVKNGSLAAQDFGGSLPRGPRGLQGPAGAAGLSGLGALPRFAFASRDPFNLGGGVPIPLTGAWTDLIGLGTPAGTAAYGSSSGPITPTAASRLIADGQAVLVNDAATSAFISCRLLLVGAAAVDIGNYISVRVPSGGEVPVTVAAGIDVEPGTYDVRLQCLSTAPSLTFHRGNLTVAATPR